MASLSFFAAHDDIAAILEFVFANTDAHVFEVASEYDQDLRKFRCVAELESVYHLGHDRFGQGMSTTVELWSPAVEPALKVERVSLRPDLCEGHTFRYALRNAGLIQLAFGGVHGRVLTKSDLGHNSEERARRWNVEEGVDWVALGKLSSRLRYHIGRRLAVANVPGRPILPHALRLAREGYSLKDSVHHSTCYEIR